MQQVHLCTINVDYGTGNFVSFCVSLGLLIMCPFCWDLKAYMWFYTYRKTPYVQSTAFEALVVDLQCYKKAYSLVSPYLFPYMHNLYSLPTTMTYIRRKIKLHL